MNHPTAWLLVASVLVSMLAGCSNTPKPIATPIPVATASSQVNSLSSVGERGLAEGWVGVDELQATDAPGDAHPHDPPSDEQVAAAVTTAAQVIAGWLTANQDQRRQLLEGVAAGALIDSFDDPRFAPAAQRQQGPTHVVDADQMQIITRHRLNIGDVVDVTLILDPDSTHGWIAIAIAT